MKTKNRQILIAAALACAVAFAATGTHAEEINTRIGKIETVNGFPTAEAAKKIFDESDFQRASQAYLWALPAVGFHGLHLAHLNIFGAKDGDVVLYVTLKDKAGMLTPNLTTIYAMSFWNLEKQGPLVIIVPAGASTRGLGADPAVEEATVRKYKLYAYDERPNPPATKFIPVGDKTWSSEQPRDLKYWEYLHDVLALEVPE